MYATVKRIFSRIPKKWVTIFSPILGVLVDRLYESYAAQTPFIGWLRIFPVLIWGTLVLGVYFLIAFIYQSIKLASEVIPQVHTDLEEFPDSRTKLPISEVSIGTFKDTELAVGILAKVILEEKTKPDVEVFLKRIFLGKPYCPKCQRTLDTTHADWMADGVQTGYKCSKCQTERRGVMSTIYKDVQGEVRRNFDTYWQTYSRAINELTHAKPEDFRVE